MAFVQYDIADLTANSDYTDKRLGAQAAAEIAGQLPLVKVESSTGFAYKTQIG
jgi:hypothetical protein